LALPSEEFDPTSSLEYGEALSCLGLLPREWAEIVLLRVIGGLDSAEVAAITGRKAGTVRVIQKRALEQLAELLSADREKAVTR
jgi:RNA polymerase sigma-70 factor (ECF subfamily)